MKQHDDKDAGNRTRALQRATDDDHTSIEDLQVLSEDFLEIAVNVECSVSVILNVLSIAFATYCVCRIYRVRKTLDPTPVFCVYFGGLVLYTATLLVTSLVVVSTQEKESTTVFWALFISEKITNASPMTLSFISIDRLLVIWLSARYVRRLQRMIAATAIVLSAVLMAVDSAIDYNFELQERQEHAGDSHVAERTTVSSLPVFDALVSFSGFFFSAVLLFFMHRLLLRNKLFKTAHLTLNHRLAALDVALHFIFDVLPVMASVFWECAGGEELSERIGPYRTLTSSANFMLCAGVQCFVIRKVTSARKPKPPAAFCKRIQINKPLVGSFVC